MSRSQVVLPVLAILLVGAGVAAFIMMADPAGPAGENPETEPRRVLRDQAELHDMLRVGRKHPSWLDLLAGRAELDTVSSKILFDVLTDRSIEMGMRHHAIILLGLHPDADIGARLVEIMRGPPRLEEPLLRIVLMALEHRKDKDQAGALVAMAADAEMEEALVPLFASTVHHLEAEVSLDPLREVARNHDEVARRSAAAVGLLLCQGPGVSPEIDEILRTDPDQGVRFDLVGAIHQRGDPEGLRYLVALIPDESLPLDIRRHTAEALNNLRDPLALEALEKIVVQGEVPEEVLLGAARSLGRCAPKGLARKLRGGLVFGRPEKVRIATAIALRTGRDREGLGDVRRALTAAENPSARLRAELAAALGELGGRADRVQLETMRDEDPDEAVRGAAGRALVRLDEILMSEPDR